MAFLLDCVLNWFLLCRLQRLLRIGQLLDQAPLSAECMSCATLSHCQSHSHVSHRSIAYRDCTLRVNGSVCKLSLACSSLQWFLTHPWASSMLNLDSNLHRDTEDTGHYHSCVAFLCGLPVWLFGCANCCVRM